MSGRVVLDAGVLIALFDADDAHNPAAAESVKKVLKSRGSFLLSAATYAEFLVGPMRKGPMFVRRAESHFRLIRDIEIVDVDVDHARRAALRRAEDRRLKLPDALVIATADLAGAERVLTTDRRLARLDGVSTLEEFVSESGK